jgi:hypothetical protein
MTQTNRFALMLEALTELVAEEKQPRPAGPATALPSLRDVVSSAAPLPHEAVFLGLAEDGLPVLLNLYDPLPGPLLVTGDQASGKTELLHCVARAVELLHAPAEVEFGVVTGHPDDWSDFQDCPNSAGIYSTNENTAQDFINSLVSWAHNNKGENQSVLLLIDDLESATRLTGETEQNLRWLLLRGPNNRVWPIVTLNAGVADKMQAWLGFFRTRLFGHIANAPDAVITTGLDDIEMNDLVPGSQFRMREGNNWLTFWIPTID